MCFLCCRKLPHSIHYDTREVCLFVKDLDVNDREYEKTVWHYQDLFRQKGIAHISKVRSDSFGKRKPHTCVMVDN